MKKACWACPRPAVELNGVYGVFVKLAFVEDQRVCRHSRQSEADTWQHGQRLSFRVSY